LRAVLIPLPCTKYLTLEISLSCDQRSVAPYTTLYYVDDGAVLRIR
jgi:hypothetical protein